jgi:cell wall-associated NlpC family hydrolase
MSARVVSLATAVVLAPLLFVVLAASLVVGTGNCPAPPSTIVASGRPATPVPGFDVEQTTNATAIVATGASLGVPARGWIVALATALTESELHTVNHGDSAGPDSRGLFQQRTAWGPLEVRMDPAGSARLFYTGGRTGQPGLLQIPDWPTRALTAVAHQIQHNDDPNAYAHAEPAATALVNDLGPRVLKSMPPDAAHGPGLSGCASNDTIAETALPKGFQLPAGAPTPVTIAITWALAQRGTPYHFGGDCTDPHSGIPAHQCDCSSLVQMAYRAGNVSLPRTTGQQIHIGQAVRDTSRLRPGDLVFPADSHGAAPHHVGLYIGDGLIVSAPHTGTTVRISHVSTWHSIAAVRRPVP